VRRNAPPFSPPSPFFNFIEMLRGAQVKVLNRAALRSARKNAAVFNAARNLATKAATPAFTAPSVPRATPVKAASREFLHHLYLSFELLELSPTLRDVERSRFRSEVGSSQSRLKPRCSRSRTTLTDPDRSPLIRIARSYATAAKNQVGKVKTVIGAVVDVSLPRITSSRFFVPSTLTRSLLDRFNSIPMIFLLS
jgi:hypothetical protein